MRSDGKIKLLNMDCLEFMKQCKDKEFELAICDPPYGINADQKRGDTGRNGHIKQKDYHIGNWDTGIPSAEYFAELKRISKNQIIWGGNYFLDYLGSTSCFIVWDKDNGENLYADCELAWTSFNSAVRKAKYKWHGFLQGDMKNKENRIHPTQKPVNLYAWILDNYAKPNMKIIDTHLGSGSSAIAAHYFGCDFTGIEIDTVYFEQMMKRYEANTLQTKLF